VRIQNSLHNSWARMCTLHTYRRWALIYQSALTFRRAVSVCPEYQSITRDSEWADRSQRRYLWKHEGKTQHPSITREMLTHSSALVSQKAPSIQLLEQALTAVGTNPAYMCFSRRTPSLYVCTDRLSDLELFLFITTRLLSSLSRSSNPLIDHIDSSPNANSGPCAPENDLPSLSLVPARSSPAQSASTEQHSD
jgi:hypothetical protein